MLESIETSRIILLSTKKMKEFTFAVAYGGREQFISEGLLNLIGRLMRMIFDNI